LELGLALGEPTSLTGKHLLLTSNDNVMISTQCGSGTYSNECHL